MKNPPTLADACIASALDKRWMPMHGRRVDILRGILRSVAEARKFVLDGSMSRFLADLADSFWHGGLRKRVRMLENARQFARLPHALTWIEFSYHSDYLPRIVELKSQGVIALSGQNPDRMGWLARQHPHNAAAFMACEIRSSVNIPGRVFVHPMGEAWCTNDEPSPWRRFPPAELIRLVSDEVAPLTSDETAMAASVAAMPGYRSRQVHWYGFLGEADTVDVLNELSRAFADKGGHQLEAATKPAVALRTLWALLATINDLPITIETVEPSKGYVARGSYKKFLKHSVVHLTVPATHFRRLVLKTSALLRRRAHQVRGHWRKDWRFPLSKMCEHEFDEHMVCKRCQGHQIWVHEHQRGDASIGFVTHDYEITRDRPTNDGAREHARKP